MTSWMNSAGHRANIMNGEFTEVGFGMANVENYQDTGPQTIVVAMYGSPKVAAATTTKPAPVAAAPKQVAATPTPTPTAEQTVPPPVQPTNEDTVVAAELEQEIAPASQSVARIQLLTGAIAPWTILAITILATIAVGVVLLRHSLSWHRALLRGERFILKHKFLDIALVLVGVLGFVLTRTAGSIH